MTTILNHSAVLLFFATLLFLILFAGVVILWYAARMNLNVGVDLLRSSINLLSSEEGCISNSCRREFQRVDIKGLRADISDGLASYSGRVTNISSHGLCLRDLPEKLSDSRALLSVVVQGDIENYRMVARPRWTSVQKNKDKTLGVEIASAPTGWQKFVSSH